MSDLISATDQDGDALNYFLFDGTVGGGHLAVDGVEQAAGQLVNLTAAQLAQTTFVPAANGSDDFVVFATDGENLVIGRSCTSRDRPTVRSAHGRAYTSYDALTH
jgi:hypothetical protein